MSKTTDNKLPMPPEHRDTRIIRQMTELAQQRDELLAESAREKLAIAKLLVERNEAIESCEQLRETLGIVVTKRDTLLAALRAMLAMPCTPLRGDEARQQADCVQQARAAIAKVERWQS